MGCGEGFWGEMHCDVGAGVTAMCVVCYVHRMCGIVHVKSLFRCLHGVVHTVQCGFACHELPFFLSFRFFVFLSSRLVSGARSSLLSPLHAAIGVCCVAHDKLRVVGSDSPDAGGVLGPFGVYRGLAACRCGYDAPG